MSSNEEGGNRSRDWPKDLLRRTRVAKTDHRDHVSKVRRVIKLFCPFKSPVPNRNYNALLQREGETVIWPFTGTARAN